MALPDQKRLVPVLMLLIGLCALASYSLVKNMVSSGKNRISIRTNS
jgi:hypothetical protein